MVVKLIPIALTYLAAMCLAAQGQMSKPTFEVASIKPATPQGPMGMRANRKGGPGTGDPGTYTCENCPVYWVLSEAYDLQPYEYAGPDWLENIRFDFVAKVPPGTTKEAFRAMLQSLLAERFKLEVHHEKKDMAVYELTVVKSGPKFQPSVPKDAHQEDSEAQRMQRDPEGFPILKAGMSMAVVPGHARIRSDNQTMEWLARMLAGQLHSPVIDTTGLTGKYDYTLSWSWEENRGADGAAVDEYHPALINALPSQLGLRLAQKKGQAEVLVVDRMEKVPTAN